MRPLSASAASCWLSADALLGIWQTSEYDRRLRREEVLERAFGDELVQAMPHLRAFAISLHGNIDRADDLVQETLERALKARDHFVPGTNLRAWLFTILRNAFYNYHRRRRFEAEDVDDVLANSLPCEPSQIVSIEVSECLAALAQLPADQREALLLVTTQELDYAEAAVVCGCSVGTVKSRVSRARTRLAELMYRDRETGEALDAGPRKAAATRQSTASTRAAA